MKIAYCVFGLGESTGCKILTKILTLCGIYGTDADRQEFDDFIDNTEEFNN